MRAGGAVAGEPGRRLTCQQERLVADFASIVLFGVDAERSSHRAAIATGKEVHGHAPVLHHLGERERGGRFTATTDSHIADADHGHTHTFRRDKGAAYLVAS